MEVTIHVGHKSITQFDDGSIWIKDDSGEGLSIPTKSELMENLEKIIHFFFSEHF